MAVSLAPVCLGNGVERLPSGRLMGGVHLRLCRLSAWSGKELGPLTAEFNRASAAKGVLTWR
jgi:hypothetical protein